MTKKQLISNIKEAAGITAKQAEAAWDQIWADIYAAPETTTPLGKFKWTKRAERKCHDPRTMEPIIVPEKSVLTFRARKQ